MSPFGTSKEQVKYISSFLTPFIEMYGKDTFTLKGNTIAQLEIPCLDWYLFAAIMACEF